ncbi:MAG TPA: zinc ribbon domain-containing protein [Firmicutes bacterium]|nr:zinc ribbon domain-containing protein [Bacillota bacterium]
MPVYEFRCRACGHKFEILCRMGETGAGLECPQCGAKAPTRLISAFRTISSGGNGGGSSGSSCAGCTSHSCSTCR